MDPAIFGKHFFPWVFSSINCRNRLEIALKRFSSIRRWTLKKIRSKNIESFTTKIYFEKTFFWKFHRFSIIFLKISLITGRFLIILQRNCINPIINWNHGKYINQFPNYIFVEKKYVFFARIFLRVHLLIEENRFKAISGRFRQCSSAKPLGKKFWTEIRALW